MLKSSTSSPRRAGFTLVEMLVAAAVSILLMVIITGAFTQGLDMFRRLRAQAKLQDTIRQAGTTIKDDLSWNHFQMPSQSGISGYGDDTANLRGQDLTKADHDWQPPPDGFFRIINGNDPNGGGVTGQFPNGVNPFVFDGTDSFGYPFTRATTHALHFTVQRPASGPDQMFKTIDMFRGPPFVTPQPGGGQPPNLFFPNSFVDPPDYREPQANATFSTRWAEVAYYLVSNGESANGVPLFNLYRAQKLLMPLPSNGTPSSNGGGPANAMVVVGGNGGGNTGPQPTGTQYNTEMSRHYNVTPPANPNAGDVRQFNPATYTALPPATYVNPPPPANGQDTEVYNRTNDVTQPCFRFGMLPASNRMPRATNRPNPPPTPPSVHSRSFHNLAGLFQIASPGARLPQQYNWRYPVMADNTGFGVGVNDLRANNDLLLLNVISFEVKALWSGSPAPQMSYTIPGVANPVVNADFPFDYIPESTANLALRNRGLRVFDTWSGRAPNNTSPYNFTQVVAGTTMPPMWQRLDAQPNADDTAARLPLRIRVRAVQIRIRIWDQKSEQTRQVTIVQDV